MVDSRPRRSVTGQEEAAEMQRKRGYYRTSNTCAQRVTEYRDNAGPRGTKDSETGQMKASIIVYFTGSRRSGPPPRPTLGSNAALGAKGKNYLEWTCRQIVSKKSEIRMNVKFQK